MPIQEGQPAPDFELPASDGTRIKLSNMRGKHVVLYFYPKDMTPGCTTEACDFRDHSGDFAGLDTVILGVSADSLARHDKFIQKYNLPFLLLADEDHKVAELYEVWNQKSLYGKLFMGIVRSTFVIDQEGILRKVWRKVKVKNHVEEALEFIRNRLQE